LARRRFCRYFKVGDAQAKLQVFLVANQHIHVLDNATHDRNGFFLSAPDVPRFGAVVQMKRSYRILQDQALLKNTSTSIAEIAYQVGFKDQAYFSRVFSKQVGVSPNEFKNG